MSSTVFWSWQSDKPGKTSRHFLKEVLEEALEQAGQDLDLDESERPGLDHDTKGQPGLVSIPDSILAKIDAADVFVADLTPVAKSPNGRFVANPNVLIELGYAKKALGPSQIILIWNAASGGCQPEDLPFDLRHRRMPFTYQLDDSASRTEIAAAKRKLLPSLKEALKASLANVKRDELSEPSVIEGIHSRDGEHSVWFEKETTFVVNNATSFGSDHIKFEEGPRSFMRVIPASWPAGLRASKIFEDLFAGVEPLGDGMGLSRGRTRGGMITYRVGNRTENEVISQSATQWFESTGELWGFDSRITYEDDQGRRALATHSVVGCWLRFLRRAANFYSRYEVEGPFRVICGISQLEGIYWPPNLWGETAESLETSMTLSESLDSLKSEMRQELIAKLHAMMRDTFGFEPDASELEEIIKQTRR